MNDSPHPKLAGEDVTSTPISRDLIERFLDSSKVETPLLPEERTRFIDTALIYQLNPFKRELHARITTERGVRKFSLIVGYEVYIKKAERTGLLDGWKAWIEGSGEELKAIVEISRKDWGKSFVHEVYWAEAVQKDDQGHVFDFWARMPRFQLKKVAISQGFRLCFSDEIGGIPYDGSELPITEKETEKKTPVAPTAGTLGQNNAQGAGTPLHSSADLATTIKDLALENKALFSSQHLEWIISQTTTQKTERQLAGLIKHVKETIANGGDVEKKPGTTKGADVNRRFASRRQQGPNLKPAAGAEGTVF